MATTRFYNKDQTASNSEDFGTHPMAALQKGIQPRISRIDTNFLSGADKAIRVLREIRGKEDFLQQGHPIKKEQQRGRTWN
ncbi:MAG: hypothetical protein HC802_05375 [Caldilineaceae bacterium]|nr:hypothetical protein [Caldilineaceae bacterium]